MRSVRDHVCQIDKHTTRFKVGSSSHPYTVIHPLTPLEELEEFFNKAGTDFALGKSFHVMR
jgi:hypothetical protein